MVTKILNFLKNPLILFAHLSRPLKDDKLYLRILYFCYLQKFLNLKNPRTFNEKLQWLKLYNHNPLYTKLVDKIEVRSYIDNILGPGHTFPLLGTWDKPEDIDFDSLPNEFVLKCNHNSAVGMAICMDKNNGVYTKAHGCDKIKITKEQVIKGLHEGLSQDFFRGGREWPYKNVKRRILAEAFMKSEDGEPLKDYKILCFNGEPKYIWVGSSYDPVWFDLYSVDWNNLHVKWGHDAGPDKLPKPENLDELIETAKKLSQGIPHVRVDLYSIGGNIYFGEFTFFTYAGLKKFEPQEWDLKLGQDIILPSPRV